MRKVARYAFDLRAADIDGPGVWDSSQQLAEQWLDSKGTRHEADGVTELSLSDGRTGTLSVTHLGGGNVEAMVRVVEEPTDGGRFRTTLALGRNAETIAVTCELEAGSPVSVLAPVFFDARCPQVLRDLIDKGHPWSVRGTRVMSKPLRFDHDDGGDALGALIKSNDRSLPLIVVSEDQGLVLHPGIVDALAWDLTAMAIVAVATTSASWRLTNTLGVDWSCYNGALRLYWPLSATGDDPFKHPLWTPRRLLDGVHGTPEAAKRIRTQLRRKILGLSTLTMHRHTVFDEAERAQRVQMLELRRKEAASQQELLDLYEDDNERLDSENRALTEKVVRLEADLANAQAMLEWAKKESPEEIPPDEEVPPATVDAAVEKAKQKHSSVLVFGNDVNGGVNTLADDAGPPDKILDYLRGLAELAIALRKSPLGASKVKWLEDRGFHVSGESDTIRSSKAEMKLRTWHDGQVRREFEFHMKPSDATSPDRCVRIYFDWDQDLRKVVIGWVGRKPGL
ncbi:MAG: hypothetical protein M0R76_00100 [Proteobacteria bacterium]|nr:hypothetical protein [Pseudomonadota bacterium]